MASDILTLTVGGQVYDGWTSIRVTRAIEQGASDFDIEVSDRWAIPGTSVVKFWQIQLFQPCVISIDGTPVLTGYVERYEPSYSSGEHRVRVAGRSKTCDLIDCMPSVGTGQFAGYTLDKIVSALARPFEIGMIVDAPMGAAIPTFVLEKTETAHGAIEKLCRLRSVLATDDENGNIVLTQAGKGGSAGALVEGGNIKSASARLTCNERFADYYVLAQAPLSFNGENVQLNVRGHASDLGCPRPRRFAEHAEHAADNATSAARAKWRALHNAAKGIEAAITAQGWRQPDGSFWKINQTIPVQSPMLQLNRPLLAGKVSLLLDRSGGRRTEITLAPQEAYTPEPEAVKGGKGSNSIWSEAQKVTGGD